MDSKQAGVEKSPSSPSENLRSRLSFARMPSRALRIAVIYAVFAFLWIYFSDQALSTLLQNPRALVQWSVYKGLSFVIVTSLLLFLLMRRAFGAVEDSYLALKDKEKQLRASQEQLSTIVGCAMDAIITTDGSGRILLFNGAAEKMFGCPESQALNRNLEYFLAGPWEKTDEVNLVLSGLRKASEAQAGEGEASEAQVEETFPVEASVSQTGSNGQQLITFILRDITQRLAYEAEIERLRRLYAALSQVNQAIVWSQTREELFSTICRVLVEFGGFRMAWLGLQEPATSTITPVAQYGDDAGYLDGIRIYTDERAEGYGPASVAFREQRPYICNDISTDPVLLRWRDHALQHGFRACMSLPIRLQNEVCGVLNVYAPEMEFFQDRETALLVEAASDISFALDNLAREEERRQAEAVAQREQLFSNTMIESMPGIVYFYNEQGNFLRWNRNFETVSGYSAQEIAQMHPLDFFADDDKQSVQGRIAEVFARGESFVEAPFVTKDGTTTPYLFTGRRLEFDGIPSLVGMGIDVTDLKAAEKALRASEERYRSTLESILEGCQLIGYDWKYLYLNDIAALHNRRPNEELIGRSMPESWPGIEKTELFALMRCCMEERLPFRTETEFVFPDGTNGWFDVSAQPVAEGILVLSIDITERHRAEVALRELNETLESKVVQRTADLQDALARAESADRIKSAFLATMSHELRTPLNSIIGFTGIILQELAGPLNAEQAKQLGMVRTSARHLLELINDVLDLSKIEAQQLEVRSEPFDLNVLLERVLASVKPLAEKKSLYLKLEVLRSPGMMVSDRRRVEQVLLNLLNNAIKFTEQGGVTVTVDMVDRYRAASSAIACLAVSIRVADTGIGIKPEDLVTLFQPFRQIDIGLARQHEGTGLGLAICRRLVTLMGGEVSASSQWMRGSEFTVILPVQNRVEPL